MDRVSTNSDFPQQQLPNVVSDKDLYQVVETSPCLSVPSLQGEEIMSRWRIFKNLFVLCFTYCLFYTGFWALTNLQSTMNAAAGMGPDSQAVIYGFSMASSLFLPEMTMDWYGCKKVMIVATSLCLPYIAANIYLRWDALLISSALYGLASGPYSAAFTVYIDEIALQFERSVDENVEFIMACFFGFYTFFMENTQVWGNIVSSLVLRPDKLPDIINASKPEQCGINFDLGGNSTNTNLTPPSHEERFLLVGIFIGMGVVSLILFGLFLDPLKNDIKRDGCDAVAGRFVKSLKHYRTFHQILLIPITIYIGIESALYSNEFTQAYIACSWGVHHVGFVTVCFGVCGALMSLLVGPLVKCISQMAVLILAALANVSICIVLFLWEPTPEFKTMYFVIAGVWGMGDAIWWSQVTALYGLMFPNDREAAFSNLYFWSFLGFFLSYSYANYFTVAVKINILLCFLLAGMLGYMIGQIRLKCSSRKEYVPIPDSGDSS
ncbi:protein unc-93 homolog A-like isoform X2 [Argiope bruennichi]|uniref:protein unc-93 homolog A-like isoform X2 n=1 Tax=Argiope bruennichi TaxID=94029 RepID=UPI002495377D|nr:protein unc-93 homolog A-like isoform X2 [Argiope bruennichi]